LSLNESNQARVALNKELFKYVKEKIQPLVEDEDPQVFPNERFYVMQEIDKADFL